MVATNMDSIQTQHLKGAQTWDICRRAFAQSKFTMIGKKNILMLLPSVSMTISKGLVKNVKNFATWSSRTPSAFSRILSMSRCVCRKRCKDLKEVSDWISSFMHIGASKETILSSSFYLAGKMQRLVELSYIAAPPPPLLQYLMNNGRHGQNLSLAPVKAQFFLAPLWKTALCTQKNKDIPNVCKFKRTIL